MKRGSLASAIVLLLTATLLPSSVNAAAWSWGIDTSQNNDVWLRSYSDGQAMFNYRLGAGGAISQITKSDVQLLAPSFKTEVTDRVAQWTCWSSAVQNTIPNFHWFENQFNVTQAGTGDNLLSPTMSVRVSPTTNTIDVYSVPQDQFMTQQQSHMQSKFSCLTRYQLMDQGIVKVRHVIRVGDVTLNGIPKTFADVVPGPAWSPQVRSLYAEAWTPFARSSDTFNALAYELDASGNPVAGKYFVGEDIKNYTGTMPVESTSGYAVVYNPASSAASTAFGVVYGNEQMAARGAGANPDTYMLNVMRFDTGIAVLPGMWMYNEVPIGSLLDQSMLLVPSLGLNAATSSLLSSLVPTVDAPAIYEPGMALSGDLSSISDMLIANLSATGFRTDHLAGLVVMVPEPGALAMLLGAVAFGCFYFFRRFR